MCFNQQDNLKTYKEMKVYLYTLSLSTRCRRATSFMPQPLYPQKKSPKHPFDRWLGVFQTQFACCGEENTVLRKFIPAFQMTIL